MREEDIWVFYTYVDKVISNLAEIPLSVFDLCRIEKMRRKEDRERSLAGRLLLQHAIMNLNISKMLYALSNGISLRSHLLSQCIHFNLISRILDNVLFVR